MRLEGGAKVDTPIAGIKKSFPKRKALKDYFLFWELSLSGSMDSITKRDVVISNGAWTTDGMGDTVLLKSEKGVTL